MLAEIGGGRKAWRQKEKLISGQTAAPLGACPRSRNVFGRDPWPQILNEPKSLYQSLSGTSGSDSIQRRS